MFLKKTFVECFSNILEALLRDYWNLPKDQYLSLLTQKQLYTFNTKTSFPLRTFKKKFPGCPEHYNADRYNAEGTLQR